MSIVTKTGDTGQTGLMFNRRVAKSDQRIAACGVVDELNAALGLGRALVPVALKERLLAVQKDLVAVMGELATVPEDWPRYRESGFQSVQSSMTERIESWIREIEPAQATFQGWVMPGGSPGSAALDMARTVARRAEREIVALKEAGGVSGQEILIFMNRLSDLLWLMARWAENEEPSSPPAAE